MDHSTSKLRTVWLTQILYETKKKKKEMDGSEPRDVKNKMQGIAPRDNWQLTDWSDTYVIY